MIYADARQLALSTINSVFFADVESDDVLRADYARRYIESQVETFERLWALTDEQLVDELREISKGQMYAAEDRDWDEYEGYEVARYEVYAVQTNREEMADEAAQARLLSEPEGPLTHRPFAGLSL